MTDPCRFVLLVGSPKGDGGSSQRLGEYILDLLPDEGNHKVVHHLGKTIGRADKWAQAMMDVDAADTVILSIPLYWDALPSHATRALELLAEHRRMAPPAKSQSLVVIVNNGFPEPWHNQVALRICRRFAVEAGFAWGGGINIGGGGAISGRPLDQAGGVAIRLRDTLGKAAQAIGRGDPLGPEQEDALVQQLYPSWFSTTLGGFGWRRLARSQGNRGSLKARPYDRER